MSCKKRRTFHSGIGLANSVVPLYISEISDNSVAEEGSLCV